MVRQPTSRKPQARTHSPQGQSIGQKERHASQAAVAKDARGPDGWDEVKPTALLVLADGTVLEGQGFGATGHAVGEVCFNTAMTGYEEILTDPSYAGQLITFTFPHIGNVGTNDEDIETVNMAATPGAPSLLPKSATRSRSFPLICRSRCPTSRRRTQFPR